MKKEKLNIEPLLFETYLAMIENSVGSKMFKNSYAKVGGKKKDILKNSDRSCAFFVSSLLVVISSLIMNKKKFIQYLHATVSGTVTDMKKQGWIEIKKPKKGSVLVWEDTLERGELHSHIGFYIGKNKAISNSTSKRRIIEHHYTYGVNKGRPVRKIVQVLHHPLLK